MKTFIFALILLMVCSLSVASQDPPSPTKPPQPPVANPPKASSCPVIEVRTPMQHMVREGQSVIFIGNVGGGDPNVVPTIVWSVSAGSIKSGQGTRNIEVDSTGAAADRQIVANLWVGGYSPECAYEASGTQKVIPPAVKIDEFPELAVDKETERLTAIAESYAQAPDNMFIIAYAGRTNERGYASAALRRIKAQLSKVFDPQRLGTIDGGFREKPAFEVWISPDGAEFPHPTPTVDRKEIVFPKPTPAKKP